MLPHQKHILCVEDDEETCLLISNLLGLINCDVTTVQSVDEALNKIKSGKFDLYLLDNWLPGGSGIELCRWIRERDTKTPSSSIPAQVMKLISKRRLQPERRSIL